MILNADKLVDLAVSALARVAPLVIRTAVRRSKIDAAIKAGRVLHPALETAIADYEVVIGSFYGQFTVSVDRFLRDLESSGILSAMAEDVISGQKQDSSFTAFEGLHSAVFGENHGAARDLYDCICKSLQVSFDHLSADPTLNLLIRSVHVRLNEQIGRVQAQLSDLISYKIGRIEDIEGTLDKIAKALTPVYRNIWQETHRGRKQLSLEKVYIPSKISPRKEDASITAIIAEMSAASLSGRALASRAASLDESERHVGFVDFERYFRRVVVLGDPGGGKSTLCQYVCFTLAKKYSLGKKFVTQKTEGLEPQSVKIPIRVVLREFEAARTKDPQLDIFSFIVRDLEGLLVIPRAQIEISLRFALDLGFVVLAFDGLDEILSTNTRREYVDLVQRFCDRFPLCPALITSRLQGYDEAPLPPDFEQLVLERFDGDEVVLYTSRYLQHICGKDKVEAARLAHKFFDQTTAHASDLRSNPLMLGLMVFLFNAKGDVPSNRPEIYRECAILMYERWDQNRAIRADIPTGFDMIDLFGSVANKIFGDSDLEKGVSSEWLERTCREYFRDVFVEHAKVIDASRKIVNFLGGRSWVLSEFAPDSYKFTHRTFMEYFFAYHFSEQCDSIRQLFSRLLPRIISGEWEVISQLALQIKTFRSPRRTAEAVAEILQALREQTQNDLQRLRLSAYVAEALVYMLTSEAEARALVEEILPSLLFGKDDGTARSSLRVLRRLADVHIDRRDYVRGVIMDTVIERLTSGVSGLWKDGILIALTPPDSLRPYMFTRDSQELLLPAEVSEAVRKRLQGWLHEKALIDASAANLYWQWYQMELPDLLAKHGIEMLVAESRGVMSMSARPSPMTLIRAALEVGASTSAHSEKDGSPANEVFRAIGSADLTGDRLRKMVPHMPFGLVFPAEFWRVVLRKVGSSGVSFRGALAVFILFMLSRSPSADHVADPGQTEGKKNRTIRISGEFLDYIRGQVEKHERRENLDFRFWSEVSGRFVAV